MRGISDLCMLGALACGTLAIACMSAPDVPASGTPRDSQELTASVQAPDTAFVEQSRFEERGDHGAGGACRWGPTAPPPPNDTLTGVFREIRTISIDSESCLRVSAVGYRRARPALDSAGGESRALTRTVNPKR
jgi:hypothetical protein